MKAITTIVAITLIVILSIVFAGTAYLWLNPLIKKRQDTIKVDKLLEDFNQKNPNSLPRKIEYVAKTGGEVDFKIDVDGIWVLYPFDYEGLENNSIQFSTFSKVSNIAVGVGWISLTPGGTCPVPNKGRIGEYASIVCVKAEPEADGYILTYKISFRELEEVSGKTYKIQLKNATSVLRSAEKTMMLRFGGAADGNTTVLILF